MLKKIVALSFLAISVFMIGCGSNSDGTPAADQFAKNEPIFGNMSTADGRTGITLEASPKSVDISNGQVLVTATVVRDNVPAFGVPVTFSIKAPTEGPASIETGLTTVTTDSNGVAVTRISAGNYLTTTNVIVQATAVLGSRSAIATTTFQLVRGGGVIMFTDEAGYKPGDQENMLEPYEIKDVDPSTVPTVGVLQLLPFKVTDSNGNPRVGVPVTLSVYSIYSPSPVDVDFPLAPTRDSNQVTFTTDSAGMGIFNVAVVLRTPPVGSFTAASVVYKATVNDPIPIVAYVGGSYSITSKAPTPAEPEPEPQPQ